MKTYLQIDLNITNREQFKEYVRRIPALIQKHGGRYLVQGVEPITVNAKEDVPERSVLLEFPSRDAASSFLAERETSGLKQIWGQSTSSRILLLEGCNN